MESENKNQWKKHLPIYIIEVLVLIAVIIGAYFVSQATKVQKVNLDQSKIAVNEPTHDHAGSANDIQSENAGSQNSSTPKPSGKTEEAAEELFEEEEEDIDKEAITQSLIEKYNGNLSIAFFGVDSREGSLGAGTRSDSMMICVVDSESHEIKLVSLYRDTYLNCGEDYYNKCNTAYALGGPERALSMININTDSYVNQYVTVGFEGLIGVIDALGGIPIEVKEEEIFHLNNYQKTMAEEFGTDYTPVVFAGTQILDGLQATAYCRIRYTTGDDFRRAERQRNVVSAILERAGHVSVGSLTKAVSAVFPHIATSLDINDIISMLSVVEDYQVTTSDGFPFKGLRNGGTIGSCGSCVVPTDLEQNVIKLHEILYNEENYQVSDAVKKYSKKIKADTEDYLQY